MNLIILYFVVLWTMTSAAKTITTIAGSYSISNGDNGPPLQATVNPSDVWVNSLGDIYVSDGSTCRIRKVTNGTIYTRAGSPGCVGINTRGTPEESSIASPNGIWGDESDNIYYSNNCAVYVINSTSNSIELVAGSDLSQCGYVDGFGSDAKVNQVGGLIGNNWGTLFLADGGNNRIRNVSLASGYIGTFAGSGLSFSQYNLPALAAGINIPSDLWLDSAGNMYISSKFDYIVGRIDAITSIITAFAGTTDTNTYYDDGWDNGDGGSALAANLGQVAGISGDSAGNIYVAEINLYGVRVIDAVTGIISTICGTGKQLNSGDGGPAVDASLTEPLGVFVDIYTSNVYILESSDVRMINSTTGIIGALIGVNSDYYGDGFQATTAKFNQPSAVWEDSLGIVYIADSSNFRIRKVDSTGIVTTVAGCGSFGALTSSPVPATSAKFSTISGLWGDSVGRIYLSDSTNSFVLLYDTNLETVSVFAGQFVDCDHCDNFANHTYSPAPCIAGDSKGNVFMLLQFDSVVKKISPGGIVSSFAGTGQTGYNGDGFMANETDFSQPSALWIDSLDNIYIADKMNYRIRKITATVVGTVGYVVSTVIGAGYWSSSTIVSVSTETPIADVMGLWGDSAEHLYFAEDTYGIRAWNMKSNLVYPVAGKVNGNYADGVDSLASNMQAVSIWGNRAGDILVADMKYNTVRRITSSAVFDVYSVSISTVAGSNATTALGGFDAPVDVNSDEVKYPCAIWQDPVGNLYLSECDAAFVRMLNETTGKLSVVIGTGTSEDYQGKVTEESGIGSVYGLWGDMNGNLFLADAYFFKVKVISAITGNISEVSYSDEKNGVVIDSYYFNTPASVIGDTSGVLYVLEAAGSVIRLTWNESESIYLYSLLADSLGTPRSLWFDGNSYLYFTDRDSSTVKRLNLVDNSLATIAGGGVCCDIVSTTTPAVGAYVNVPYGLWGDSSGRLFFTEYGSAVVRMIDLATYQMTVIAGVAGFHGFTGDSVDASEVLMATVESIWGDSQGYLYIGDTGAHNIRMLHLSDVSTHAPTSVPTSKPTSPTIGPTFVPTRPTTSPSVTPSRTPSCSPSLKPTTPTIMPTETPSFAPHESEVIIYETSVIAGINKAVVSLQTLAASSSIFLNPTSVFVDSLGDMFVVDSGAYVIRHVNASSIISKVVGTGVKGSKVTNGTAALNTNLTSLSYLWCDSVGTLYFTEDTSYLSTVINDTVFYVIHDLKTPSGIFGDSQGNVYIANTGKNNIVKYFPATGINSIIVNKDGYFSNTGDNGDALYARIMLPFGVWVNSVGDLYISSSGGLRRVDSVTNIITTVDSDLNVAVTGDRNGSFYYPINAQINQRKSSGEVVTFAGSGLNYGYTGDGGSAVDALLGATNSLATDTLGALYIVDSNNCVIRKVDTEGIMHTVAGSLASYFGDGGPAVKARLSTPVAIWNDGRENLYIADYGNIVVRKISADGIITSVVGQHGISSDKNTAACVATSCLLYQPTSIWGDTLGIVYIFENQGQWVRKYDSKSDIVSIVAGEVTTGSHSNPLSVTLSASCVLSGDSVGGVYIADGDNSIIRKLIPTEDAMIHFAGVKSHAGYLDNVAATSAYFSVAGAMWVSSLGIVYVTDLINHVIRMIDTSGIVTTNAGCNPCSTSPTSGPATSIFITSTGLWGDSMGNLFFTDTNFNLVQALVFSTGIVTTISSSGYSSVNGITGNNYGVLTVTDASNGGMIKQVRPIYVTERPSLLPTALPSTVSPSANPSTSPTIAPSVLPTIRPSTVPSVLPTEAPSALPSVLPTVNSTVLPTLSPSVAPTYEPSLLPTTLPSLDPTIQPSVFPSLLPSAVPTAAPSVAPSVPPSLAPTALPSVQPSVVPTVVPTVLPSMTPTVFPTERPTCAPSALPSLTPTLVPSQLPTCVPTVTPSTIPTVQPSKPPSVAPTLKPTDIPTCLPSDSPTLLPSLEPSLVPSLCPSLIPSAPPTTTPSVPPSLTPSQAPSLLPSLHPSLPPTLLPVLLKSDTPSLSPSLPPSQDPSYSPTILPTVPPTNVPVSSSKPSVVPSCQPSVQPSLTPTLFPSVSPTAAPSQSPSARPTFVKTPNETLPLNASLSVFGDLKFKIVLPFMQVSRIVGTTFANISLTGGSFGTNAVVYGGSTLNSRVALSDCTICSHNNVVSSDFHGRSVSRVDDVNDDGVSDWIIGDPYAAKCYVMFGGESSEGLTSGFTIFGESDGDLTGWSVSGAGDVNNDTFNDLIIGAPNVNGVGAFYVIYGRRFHSDIYLSSLSPSKGFAVYGAARNDYLGISVSAAGDVNKDGFDDVIVGALITTNFYGGAAYVTYGGRSLVSVGSIASLTFEQGYKLYCAKYYLCGYSVSSAGDVNKDGFADILIGSSPQKTIIAPTAFLVYGQVAYLTANILLSSVAAPIGVQVIGGGVFVSNLGDINDDGYADLLVGSNYGFTSQSGFLIYLDVEPLTASPTIAVTKAPTVVPSVVPTLRPTRAPTINTVKPSLIPSVRPTSPTFVPTQGATAPTSMPSSAPSHPSNAPTDAPVYPSEVPSEVPTSEPSARPSEMPSIAATVLPTEIPSINPTPSSEPSSIEPSLPSLTRAPFGIPTLAPVTTTFAPSLFQEVVIDGVDTSSYVRLPGNSIITVNSTVNVSIVGALGACEFVVRNQPHTWLTIEYFNLTSDAIDLTSWSEFSDKSQLTVRAGSIIISLGEEQEIHLENLSLSDFDNVFIIFYEEPQSDSHKKKKSKGESHLVQALLVLCPVVLVFLMVYGGNMAYRHWKERQKVSKLKRNEQVKHLQRQYTVSYDPNAWCNDDLEMCAAIAIRRTKGASPSKPRKVKFEGYIDHGEDDEDDARSLHTYIDQKQYVAQFKPPLLRPREIGVDDLQFGFYIHKSDSDSSIEEPQ